MAVRNTVFTPARRGPALQDGTGGASDRKSTREPDPVLRNVGHRTEDIRLTPTGTDTSAGEGALYNFGAPDINSVGRYRMALQPAASATAEPLGAMNYIEFEIREQTAGVFNVDFRRHFDALVVAEDQTQEMSDLVAATLLSDADTPDFSAANADSATSVFVATAAQVTDLAAAGLAQGVTPVAGDLCVYDARAASTRVYSCTRIA